MRSYIKIEISQKLVIGGSFTLEVNGVNYEYNVVESNPLDTGSDVGSNSNIFFQALNVSIAIRRSIGEDILIDTQVSELEGGNYELLITALEDNVNFNLISNNTSLSFDIFNQPYLEPLQIISETITSLNDKEYNYTVIINKAFDFGRLHFLDLVNPLIFNIPFELFSSTNIANDTLTLILDKFASYKIIGEAVSGTDSFQFEFVRPPIQLLNPDDILFRTERVGNGVNLFLSYSGNSSFPLEWSFNNSDYQSSGLFLNQEAGQYTVSVKDSIGQEANTEITISIRSSDPYFLYSKLNSIRGAKQEEIDNRLIHPNDNNALSYQENVECVAKYTYNYLPTDIVRLQVKTNYDQLNAQAIGNFNTELTVIKKSNNLNRKLAYTATGNVQDGSTFITFGSGNILNYDDTSEVIEPYILNDRLPFWAIQGAIIEVNGKEYAIDQTVTNFNGTTRRAIKINDIVENVSIVRVRFDLLPYEVYEIDVPLLSYNNGCFQIKINAIDGRFNNVEFLTEEIKVVSELKKHSYFVWRSQENNDVDYSTGIYHSARFAVTKQSTGFVQDQNTFDSDTNSYLTSSENIKTISLDFDLLTTGVAENLITALSSSRLFVDGVGYVKNESFEIEGALDNSNLYRITAQLKESGFNFDFIDFEQEIPLSFANFDLPTLDSATLRAINHGSGLVNGGSGLLSNP